jgi:hypothetical protein
MGLVRLAHLADFDLDSIRDSVVRGSPDPAHPDRPQVFSAARTVL